MSKIQIEVKLSQSLRYEITRIKKEVSLVRKINRELKRQKQALLGGEKRLVKIIDNKNSEINTLKSELNTLKIRHNILLESV